MKTGFPIACVLAVAMTCATATVVRAQAAKRPAPTPAPPAAQKPAPPAAQKPAAPAAQKPAAPASATAAPAAAPATQATPGTPATQAAPAAPAGDAPTLEPQGYTYDPQGRRDPFVSLLRRGGDVERSGAAIGARPPGLAGLESSEVTLKGTLASQGSYVAILQGSDNKTYIVKAGDKLLDGTIRAITPDSMVITQAVTDPLSLEKTREVRKVLRQTDEGK